MLGTLGTSQSRRAEARRYCCHLDCIESLATVATDAMRLIYAERPQRAAIIGEVALREIAQQLPSYILKQSAARVANRKSRDLRTAPLDNTRNHNHTKGSR